MCRYGEGGGGRVLSGMYHTIVADPPWDHSDGTGFSYGSRHNSGKRLGEGGTTRPPYQPMTLDEIAALPVAALADADAHLYLWTTQRYLRPSFDIVSGWGFSVSATLTWCKAPQGFMGGAYRSSTEFCHFARRGSLAHKTQAPSQWFTWKRTGWTQNDPDAKHSRKPEAFLDLVETVSPGPYLEMFARRQRLGWDTWGDEALDHVGRFEDTA
jgi:N6-adenosine-specific RNA methylase IME4